MAKEGGDRKQGAIDRMETDGDRVVGWVCSVIDETTGGVRLPTWCDSTDLYLRECSITLRGVKERGEGGVR